MRVLVFTVILMMLTAGFAFAGNAVVDKVCSQCHTTDRVYAKKGDKKMWDGLIERMKSNGCQMTEDEEKQIKAYLYTQK